MNPLAPVTKIFAVIEPIQTLVGFQLDKATECSTISVALRLNFIIQCTNNSALLTDGEAS